MQLYDQKNRVSRICTCEQSGLSIANYGMIFLTAPTIRKIKNQKNIFSNEMEAGGQELTILCLLSGKQSMSAQRPKLAFTVPTSQSITKSVEGQMTSPRHPGDQLTRRLPNHVLIIRIRAPARLSRVLSFLSPFPVHFLLYEEFLCTYHASSGRS